jgi:hypothetical protein
MYLSELHSPVPSAELFPQTAKAKCFRNDGANTYQMLIDGTTVVQEEFAIEVKNQRVAAIYSGEPMPIGSGYAAYAGARLYTRGVGGTSPTLFYPYQAAGGSPVEPTAPALGIFTMIPFASEAMNDERKFLLDSVLSGKAGYSQQRLLGILPGGGLDLEAHYIGLDHILAAAFGIEKLRLRSGAAAESPTWAAAAGGLNGQGLTTAASGNTGSALVLSASFFPAPYTSANPFVGSYVRINDFASTVGIGDLVRRITAVSSATAATVSPAWNNSGGLDPVNSKICDIGSMWMHQFDCSRHMHIQPYTELNSDAYLNLNAAADPYLLSRMILICVAKGVSNWAFIACQIESLTLKFGTEGLRLSGELLPFRIDTAAGAFTPYYLPNTSCKIPFVEQIGFADSTFSLGAYSTSVPLAASDQVGISELEITIKHNLQGDLQTTVSPLRRAEPMRTAKREVTGSFTIPRYLTNARLTNFANQDDLMAMLDFKGTQLISGVTGGYNRLRLFMRRLRLTKPDTAVSGPALIPEKHTFRCIMPYDTDVPALGNAVGGGYYTAFEENGEVGIQTVNQNPYNAFHGQQREDAMP